MFQQNAFFYKYIPDDNHLIAKIAPFRRFNNHPVFSKHIVIVRFYQTYLAQQISVGPKEKGRENTVFSFTREYLFINSSTTGKEIYMKENTLAFYIKYWTDIIK